MRKALIVGINDYPTSPLAACIPDANRINNILSKNYDESPNFFCKKVISSDVTITRNVLKDAIIDLFSTDSDVALFYFSGHGCEADDKVKSSLVTQDANGSEMGVELEFLMEKANNSKAKQVVIILDCCFSGAAGNLSFLQNLTVLREGVSILTSSHESQVSFESPTGGIFTDIVVEALEGGASDTIGLITVAGIYEFADKLLGPWDQRPIFKANISSMIPLRKSKPRIAHETLRKLPMLFSTPDFIFPLDPTFEPDAEPRGHSNEATFDELQRLNRNSLLEPNGEDHMYFAAINSKSCSLTPLGKYYWKLAKEGKL
ncbi:caspase family protein [Sphingobacterium chungjuense]|uniref:caspase family protein n=1 Tax=Sphingobacterium chungjuense TaxID=2675553 RepID=UPI00140BE116|nr:caspase family protein [Sphingobacterium chungjuense]